MSIIFVCWTVVISSNVYPAPETFHIPRVETVDGALDLFSLCFLVIFGNVLDFRTYSTPDGQPLDNDNPHDVNGIAIEERYNMCTARGVCIELLRWWSSKYGLRHTAVRTQGRVWTQAPLRQGMKKRRTMISLLPLSWRKLLYCRSTKSGPNSRTGKGLLVAVPADFKTRF